MLTGELLPELLLALLTAKSWAPGGYPGFSVLSCQCPAVILLLLRAHLGNIAICFPLQLGAIAFHELLCFAAPPNCGSGFACVFTSTFPIDLPPKSSCSLEEQQTAASPVLRVLPLISAILSGSTCSQMARNYKLKAGTANCP